MFTRIGGSRIALPVLLLASLALNGFLLLRASTSASRTGAPGAEGRQNPRTAGNAGTTSPLAQCRRNLRIQQLRTLHLARRQLSALQKPPLVRQDDEEPEADARPRLTGFGAQQKMLCTLGMEELRRNWEHGKELIHDNLARDLASTDSQARDMNRTLDSFGEVLNLSGLQLSQLEKRYSPLRSRRVEAALDALQSDPPDYLAAFDEALDLYQDTDELVAQLYGAPAVEKVRSTELRRRTQVLAVLASLADVSWDRSIEW